MREEASMWLSATHDFESALPGEWAALVMTVMVAGLVGGAVLMVACVLHERGLARRRGGRGAVGKGAVREGAVRKGVAGRGVAERVRMGRQVGDGSRGPGRVGRRVGG